MVGVVGSIKGVANCMVGVIHIRVKAVPSRTRTIGGLPRVAGPVVAGTEPFCLSYVGSLQQTLPC